MLKHMLIAVCIAAGVGACEQAIANPPMPKAIIDPILWNSYVPRVHFPEHNPERSMVLTPVKKKYLKGIKKPAPKSKQ